MNTSWPKLAINPTIQFARFKNFRGKSASILRNLKNLKQTFDDFSELFRSVFKDLVFLKIDAHAMLNRINRQ